MLQTLLSTGFAVLASLIWVHAGGLKLARTGDYSAIAEGYMGWPVAPSLLRLLGCAEIVLAIGLLLPASRIWAAYGSAALFLGYALLMGRQISAQHMAMRCGCGGFGADTRVSWELVGRNLGLVFTMLYLTVPAVVALDWVLVTGVVFGVGLYVCYLALDQLIANSQRIRGLA